MNPTPTPHSFRKVVFIPFLLILLAGCIQSAYNLDLTRWEHAQNELEQLYQDIEPPETPLTLNDILAIALRRNLDLFVKQYEAVIEHETITREALRMLPSLNINMENSGRSNLLASTSTSLVPGVPPAPLSTSTDSHKYTWDATLIWSLLDFGISYYRAREEANKALIKDLEYKRLQQNLVLNVLKQYWKAIIAKKALDVGKTIDTKIQKQKAVLQSEVEARVLSRIVGLNLEHRLLTTQLQMRNYIADYLNAKAELANLMALPPGIEFELADPDLEFPLENIGSLDCLINMALQNRPELYGLDVEEKNSEEEVRVNIINLLPQISPFATDSHDANSFLLHKYWGTAGIRLAWDLLQTPLKLKNLTIIQMQKELARKKRLTLSMGILVQVQISFLLFHEALEKYRISKELMQNDAEIVRVLNLAQQYGAYAMADILNYEVDALNSEIEALKTFAEMSVALEQLNNAMGLPRYLANTEDWGEEE